MAKHIDKIDYDNLVEKALKNVMVDALKIAQEQGLPDDNHFYISFRTDHPQTVVHNLIKSQYPQEMTIVLQHQFSNLKVDNKGFSVTLSFGNAPYDMSIPFDAVTYFGDPSVHFGISFGSEIDSNTPSEQKKSLHRNADIVSIDAFRKNGNA